MRNFIFTMVTAFLLSLAFSPIAVAHKDKSDGDREDKSPHCRAIAKACSEAGFERKGESGKRFWQDCMKPILTGRKVEGVAVERKDIDACRQFKVKDLRKKLHDLEKPMRNQ